MSTLPKEFIDILKGKTSVPSNHSWFQYNYRHVNYDVYNLYIERGLIGKEDSIEEPKVSDFYNTSDKTGSKHIGLDLDYWIGQNYPF